jgi:hypothetical protein
LIDFQQDNIEQEECVPGPRAIAALAVQNGQNI